MPEAAIDREQLEREAVRVYLRYAQEAVEALGLCPWARAAREEGRVELRVVFGREPQLTAALAAIDSVSARAETDIALLLFPELELDRVPFAHFVSELRAADAARYAVGDAPFALADFHPNAVADTGTPERLVPFIRSSPDPTVQLVRRSALEAVRMTDAQGTSFFDASRMSLAELLDSAAPTPPLAQRIAKQNLRTLEKLGIERVAAIFRDVIRDRDASYAALGVKLPAWAKARTSLDED
ncbi:MAG TPA: DUF1415 family protein [Polyangiales bacterium]|jgi:hypothetical protein|nr:DUF1415 family protein [Polyangiales bacterium]